jgi:nucleoside-diphosphate-sugar epimerase
MTQTILVTGASGFVAAHVVHDFLAAGYNVRATVRSESTAARVLASHSGFESKLSFAICPDISQPGAFDEAVKDVDGVIHVASPFILNATDYEKDLYAPAINGTLSILDAVHKFNDKVKRVVITGSFAAVKDLMQGPRHGYVYTEDDWNPMTKEVAEKAGPGPAYSVSKTLAERAAFDFVKQKKVRYTCL